jgi:hypothetical protein
MPVGVAKSMPVGLGRGGGCGWGGVTGPQAYIISVLTDGTPCLYMHYRDYGTMVRWHKIRQNVGGSTHTDSDSQQWLLAAAWDLWVQFRILMY